MHSFQVQATTPDFCLISFARTMHVKIAATCAHTSTQSITAHLQLIQIQKWSHTLPYVYSVSSKYCTLHLHNYPRHQIFLRKSLWMLYLHIQSRNVAILKIIISKHLPHYNKLAATEALILGPIQIEQSFDHPAYLSRPTNKLIL